MATATPRTRKPAAKKPPVVEPEVIEEDLEEEPEEDEELLEELEEDEEVVETKAKPKAKAAKAPAERKTPVVVFGIASLAEHISKKVGKTITTRELRQLARKLARDDSGRIEREIVAGNRARYDWPDGLDNPEVQALIAAYEGGELEADKQAKLAALKASKDAKTAAKRAAAAEAEEVDEEEDEPAKPAAKKVTKVTATPAKKTRAKAPVVVEEDDEELDLDED